MFGGFAPPASAQGAGPGDSYLNAIRLNPGTGSKPDPIAEPAGATFSADTTSYGTEGMTGGTPEPNRCRPVTYGRTAWAWLYTPRWVQTDLKVTASFNALFALMPFRSPDNPTLDAGAGICVNTAGTSVAFPQPLPIVGPGWYAIQVGGKDGAGGTVSATVHLLPPPELAAVARTSSSRAGAAAKVRLRVKTDQGATVALRCLRKSCGRLVGVKRTPNARSRTYLRDEPIPDGARLELRVMKPGRIGYYSSWDVAKGKLGRPRVRCMEPASTRPQTRCDG
jgi:hypothetical protein